MTETERQLPALAAPLFNADSTVMAPAPTWSWDDEGFGLGGRVWGGRSPLLTVPPSVRTGVWVPTGGVHQDDADERPCFVALISGYCPKR